MRAVVFALCGGLLLGCGAKPRPAPVVPSAPAPTAPPPIVTTAQDGLEVHWWIADDTDGAVGAVLSEFVEPALPADLSVRARWNANGLRLVQVPIERFGELESRLPATRTRTRLWVGWVTSWTEVLRGRRAGGASALIIDGQRSLLPLGALRLIARSWPAPSEPSGNQSWGDRPAARLELACQLVVEAPLTATDVFEQPRLTDVPDEGPVFRQLTLETLLDARFAYVVTSEAPGILWTSAGRRTIGSADVSPPPATPDIPDSQVEQQRHAEDNIELPFEPLGPPVSTPLTIGQAMLSASHSETGRRDVRIIMVLVPRTPERFRLLP